MGLKDKNNLINDGRILVVMLFFYYNYRKLNQHEKYIDALIVKVGRSEKFNFNNMLVLDSKERYSFLETYR